METHLGEKNNPAECLTTTKLAKINCCYRLKKSMYSISKIIIVISFQIYCVLIAVIFRFQRHKKQYAPMCVVSEVFWGKIAVTLKC